MQLQCNCSILKCRCYIVFKNVYYSVTAIQCLQCIVEYERYIVFLDCIILIIIVKNVV